MNAAAMLLKFFSVVSFVIILVQFLLNAVAKFLLHGKVLVNEDGPEPKTLRTTNIQKLICTFIVALYISSFDFDVRFFVLHFIDMRIFKTVSACH